MTVLIVDDDPDSLELIDRYVKYSGYDSIIVDSGAEAIRVLREVTPEAVILDAVMPEISGLDVMREVKKIKKAQNVPIVMISALGPGIKLMLDPEVQADYYMSKPFSGKELQLILDKLITEKDKTECLVSLNEIRKEARAHKENCFHVKDKVEFDSGKWKKFSSLDSAKLECESLGFEFKKCKICFTQPEN